MGYLIYDGADYPFDDRVLAHLKIAIGRKFRLHESFFLSWTKSSGDGGGRISLWLSPQSGLTFRFVGSRPPKLDETWLRILVSLSNGPRGMVVMTEKEAAAFARNHPEVQSAAG